jgi:hypothetical protein
MFETRRTTNRARIEGAIAVILAFVLLTAGRAMESGRSFGSFLVSKTLVQCLDGAFTPAPSELEKANEALATFLAHRDALKAHRAYEAAAEKRCIGRRYAMMYLALALRQIQSIVAGEITRSRQTKAVDILSIVREHRASKPETKAKPLVEAVACSTPVSEERGVWQRFMAFLARMWRGE